MKTAICEDIAGSQHGMLSTMLHHDQILRNDMLPAAMSVGTAMLSRVTKLAAHVKCIEP